MYSSPNDRHRRGLGDSVDSSDAGGASERTGISVFQWLSVPVTRHPYDCSAQVPRTINTEFDKQEGLRSVFCPQQTNIKISNLHLGMTTVDVRQVFNEFGPLDTTTVHYDSSGVSLGIADVVYRYKNSAFRTKRRYNNNMLDGYHIRIRLTNLLSTNTDVNQCGPIRRFNSRRVDIYNTSKKHLTTKKGLDDNLDKFVRKQQQILNSTCI